MTKPTDTPSPSAKRDAPEGRVRLYFWLGLVAALALLNVATIVFVEVPADRMYANSMVDD